MFIHMPMLDQVFWMNSKTQLLIELVDDSLTNPFLRNDNINEKH